MTLSVSEASDQKMDYRSYLQKNHVDILPCMVTFAVVVDAGSFVDASVRLGLTASAVSKQISKLEDALSMKLLERTTRQLKINAEGTQVYSHCKSVMESSANVFRLKEKFLKGPQGLLRISVPRSLLTACNEVVLRFLEMYPDVNVQLISNEKVVDLIGEGIDISILITDSPPLNLVARKLYVVDFILCAAKSYLEKRGFPSHPSSLPTHSCVLYSDMPESHQWRFTDGDEIFDVDVSGRYFAESPEAVMNATISGLGISCLPLKIAMVGVASNNLVQLLPAWRYSGPLQGMAWVTYQPARHVSLKVKMMVEYLVESLRKNQSLVE